MVMYQHTARNRGNMEELLRSWDGEDLILRYDRPTGSWIIIAIHSTRLGAATGGTRMKTYPDLDDAVRDAQALARGMTYKLALPGFPRGGGKAVIAVPGVLGESDRRDLLHRYGALVRQLGGLFETGPDVGTSPEDMNIIAETGAPYIHCLTPDRGGAGDSSPPTAKGVFQGIVVTCEHLYGEPSLQGRRVLVQGAGSVGSRLIALLAEAGAEVLASDIDESVLAAVCHRYDAAAIPADAVYDTRCDIFSPCGLGGILNADTISRLRCRAVVGAANNQLAHPDDAALLQARGILYAPDFAVNIGGAMGIAGIETLGWTEAEADERVAAAVSRSLRQIFRVSDEEGVSTVAAAEGIADEHLAGPI
jgi:leucine dehydrogenase